jgi:hypothetical protein
LDFSFLRGLTTIIFCVGAAADYELKKRRKEKKSGLRLRSNPSNKGKVDEEKGKGMMRRR